MYNLVVSLPGFFISIDFTNNIYIKCFTKKQNIYEKKRSVA